MIDEATFLTNFGAETLKTQNVIRNKAANVQQRERATLLATANATADAIDPNTLYDQWIDEEDPEPIVIADFITWMETQ